jgi:hypothetical protein
VGAALILMDHLDNTSTWQYTPTSRMLEIASSVLQAIVGARSRAPTYLRTCIT